MAVQYAERAVSLLPNDAGTQLAVAISYGKLLPLVGSKEQIADSRIMKVRWARRSGRARCQSSTFRDSKQPGRLRGS
jgi:hypothetical protein